MSTRKSVIELARKSGAKMLDLEFVDTYGRAQRAEQYLASRVDLWIATKRKERDALRLRPHPCESSLYYDF